MFKRQAESLYDIMLKSLRDLGLETPLLEKRLIDSWPEVVGPTVAQYTSDLKITNQVLCVHVNNAALRSDLMMMRSRLVQLLNDKVQSHIIIDIRLR